MLDEKISESVKDLITEMLKNKVYSEILRSDFNEIKTDGKLRSIAISLIGDSINRYIEEKADFYMASVEIEYMNIHIDINVKQKGTELSIVKKTVNIKKDKDTVANILYRALVKIGTEFKDIGKIEYERLSLLHKKVSQYENLAGTVQYKRVLREVTDRQVVTIDIEDGVIRIYTEINSKKPEDWIHRSFDELEECLDRDILKIMLNAIKLKREYVFALEIKEWEVMFKSINYTVLMCFGELFAVVYSKTKERVEDKEVIDGVMNKLNIIDTML